MEIIDDARSTSFAGSTAADSDFPQSSCFRDQVSAGRIKGDEINDRVLLSWCEQLACAPPYPANSITETG
ncbi:MAG TPA: hypothetical protein VE715_20940 [Blastocatellia bacterium]|nr:hypothetical protein [Blastocatellia bacterium]